MGDGKTALMFASEKGHIECVNLLLSEVGKTDAEG